ncbi:MAG TPA: AcvB/VirJ family lysyl-phosphatidylglycerol hydrolase [Steroidobacteraceae bacterium]|jgi:type IV secretory pathway VirJ component|nr:AcvB/VirJ family lysyl-phosphatidylglycerol hydrolase [Steroidobacteraceae bacterium]
MQFDPLRTGLRRPALRLSTLVTALFWLLLLSGANASAETLSHGRFKEVEVYRPAGEVKHVVLFLSGDGGWGRRLTTMATTLVADGTMVVGIDVPDFYEELEKDGDSCVYPDGDLENLSHFVQAYYKLPTYFTPVLVGYSAGASLAYAVIAQAPPGIFAGALSLSFCADLDLKKPLCKSDALHFSTRKDGEGVRLIPASKLRVPWVALHGSVDEVCSSAEAREFVEQTSPARFIDLPGVGHDYSRPSRWLTQFKEAYSFLLNAQPQSLPAPPSTLSDLPIVEVPASGSGGTSDLFAVLLSGDGGWAGLDKEVAAALAARGIPVAGIDSLRYFWHARTPAGLAEDIDRTIRYYASQWQKRRVVLIGYSQGADVMPFAVNRLPQATRAVVALTALIGVSQSAAFEFHVSNWVGAGSDELPVLPETNRLSSADTLCLAGDDDDDSLCPIIGATHARVVELPGGHHFGGDYHHLAELIIEQAGPVSRARK